MMEIMGGETLLWTSATDYAMRTCPRCGQVVFADMTVCYGCLCDLAADDGVEEGDKRGRDAPAASLRMRLATDLVDVLVPLPPQGLVVGRGASCDIVLHAQAVSRQHVRIEPDDAGAVVCDLGSTNGATLRGEQLDGEGHMGVGDELCVCGASLTLMGAG